MNNKKTHNQAAEEEFDGSEDGYVQAGSRRPPTQNYLIMALMSRWYWVVLLAILGFFGGLYYYAKSPKYYSAAAELIVILPERSITGTVTNAQEFDTSTVEGLNTIVNRMGRKGLLSRVAARKDVIELQELGSPPADWRPDWWKKWTGSFSSEAVKGADAKDMQQNAIMSIVADSMSVSVVPKTRLLQIGINHQNAKCAEVLANALAVEYVAEATQAIRETAKNQGNAMQIKAENDSKKLSEVHGALANYAQAILIQKELEQAERVHATLALRYKPKYPDMVEARGNLENAQKRFISELNSAMSSPVDADYWKATSPTLESSRGNAAEYLNAVRQALTSRIAVLEANANSLQAMIQSMLSGSRTSDPSAASATIKVNELASMPDIQTQPVRAKILAIGCGAGLVLGLIVAFLFAKLDNTFHSVAELEGDTECAVLAAIPSIPLNHIEAVVAHAAKKGKSVDENEHQKKWEPRLMFRPALKKTNYCESFRILRASVTLLGDENRRRVTLITSSLPGEGKSTVSTNLALATAAQGRRTLLIDFDLRKPRLHQVFGISEKPHDSLGASEWCAGTATLEECITKDVGAENLHVVFSGKRAADPGELLDPERIRELLDDVRDKYDSVIIDSAPLLAVPDTRLIAPVVDNLCLVVRSNWVPKGAVLRSLDLLESYGTRPSGLIFNGHAETRKRINQNYSYGSYRISRFGKAYQYGYGSYGSYGSYGAEDDDDDLDTPSKNKKKRK